MSRQITITRSAMEIVNPGDLQSYRYTVTASGAVDMPNEIFRMFDRPLDPLVGTVVSEFDGVCSPADLTSLPINAPIPPGINFRVSFIDLTFDSPSAGEDQWISIQSEVGQLVRSLTANDTLSVQETVIFTG